MNGECGYRLAAIADQCDDFIKLDLEEQIRKYVAELQSEMVELIHTDPQTPEERYQVFLLKKRFGAFQDGTLKYRGIELRRRDTTTWVRRIQLAVLEILSRANTPHEFSDRVPEVMTLVEHAKRELRTGRVPLEELVVRQRLSRALDGYRSSSPAPRERMQLRVQGR